MGVVAGALLGAMGLMSSSPEGTSDGCPGPIGNSDSHFGAATPLGIAIVRTEQLTHKHCYPELHKV